MENTREQEIKKGLERGELLAKLKCGCVIIQDRTADAYVIYCSKHELAPDLYEALGTIKRTSAGAGGGYDPKMVLKAVYRIANEAIAKVESKG